MLLKNFSEMHFSINSLIFPLVWNENNYSATSFNSVFFVFMTAEEATLLSFVPLVCQHNFSL